MQRCVAAVETRQRGRPRNPEFDTRSMAAAAKVYGAQGWAGFSLDAVARAANVGNSTIYARWMSADTLLGAMIEVRWCALSLIDTGEVRTDQEAFGGLVLSRYLETGGGVARHLRGDLITYPENGARIGPVIVGVTSQAIGSLRWARSRAQLRNGISLALISDMLLSSMESHAGRMLPDQNFGEAAIAAYVGRVANLLLGGIARADPA